MPAAYRGDRAEIIIRYGDSSLPVDLLDSKMEPMSQQSAQRRAVSVSHPCGHFLDAPRPVFNR